VHFIKNYLIKCLISYSNCNKNTPSKKIIYYANKNFYINLLKKNYIMKYLFLCQGNVCRSNMAEEILKERLMQINSDSLVDSAGFEPYLIGEETDKRAQNALLTKGYKPSTHRARLFQKTDFDDFDKIYVMDANIYRLVKEMARNNKDIEKIDYLMNEAYPEKNIPIVDPSFSDNLNDFINTIEMIENAIDAIIEKYEK